ncbi:uncharacterized protein LOC128870420 [Anastrepha ludens]|uniref:uncharacterized protein LOC128870420 n=1 Tax=Anastrepha ludens TaxID=28586 RepID=UPI0023B15F13|nr:uncharacterized protein LOC128870420 [Anastrepha ludens]
MPDAEKQNTFVSIETTNKWSGWIFTTDFPQRQDEQSFETASNHDEFPRMVAGYATTELNNQAVNFTNFEQDDIIYDFLDEARYNLATRVMSNGVEVIIASDKIKTPLAGVDVVTEIAAKDSSKEQQHHQLQLRIAPSKAIYRPTTLAASTLKNHMRLVMPSQNTEPTIQVRTLTSHKRHKLGLINGLGTAVKFITGNMDAFSINKQIQDIKANTTHIETILNNQNQINSIMQERLQNVTIHINKEQDKIETYINKFELQYISQINYNTDLLNNHLESIAESIVLAKLNMISKFILSTTELDQIYNYMENQSIKISSKEQIYVPLGLQAYYNNSNSYYI